MNDKRMQEILDTIDYDATAPLIVYKDIEVYETEQNETFYDPLLDFSYDSWTHFLLILKNRERAALIMSLGEDDVYWYVARRFREQHVLSTALKLDVICKAWPDSCHVTYTKPDGRDITRHLAELAGLCFKGAGDNLRRKGDRILFRARPDFRKLKLQSDDPWEAQILRDYRQNLKTLQKNGMDNPAKEVMSDENAMKIIAWLKTNLKGTSRNLHCSFMSLKTIRDLIDEDLEIIVSKEGLICLLESEDVRLIKYPYLGTGIRIDRTSPIFQKIDLYLTKKEFDKYQKKRSEKRAFKLFADEGEDE